MITISSGRRVGIPLYLGRTNVREIGDVLGPLFAAEIRFRADLSDRAEKGQVMALICPRGRTGLDPLELRVQRSDLFTARHFPGLVKPGDCVAVIAEEVVG